ncbi:MAG: hypothetical protein ABIX28_11590 [Vicinamibacterales bacterium]
MPSTSGPERPPLWVRAVDVVALALILLTLIVWASDGFAFRAGGLRLSFRSGWRIAVWALGLLVVRHLAYRRFPLHRRLGAGFAAAARSQAAPGPDPLPLGPPRSRASRLAIGLGVVALFWALTLVMTYPQVTMMNRGISPDIGDPLFSTWRLAWVAHQLPRDPLHLFDGNIFHPAKQTLAFSDAMLVPSLTAAPLLWMGMHQLYVYNVLLLSGFAFSGAAMFLLVRSLTGHTGAALIAGFVFAFLPYRYMHYAHLELQMAQWMPMTLWALHRTFSAGRVRDGLLTGLFLACQALSSFYYGIFFATFLIPVGLALLLGAEPARRWPAIKALAVGAVLAAVLVVPVTRPYFAARQSVGERPLSEVDFYSALPQDYLVAHPRNLMMGPLSVGRGSQERELFMGVVTPVIAIAALWPPLSAARMGYGAGLALAFELSLGTNGKLYPWMREHLVPFRGLRVPARMAIVVGLALAVLVGYAVARISRAGSSRAAQIAAVVVIALPIAYEYRSRLPLRVMWTSPSPAYATLPPGPDAVLLELPLITPDVALEPIYMYFSTFHWRPLANGYSGFAPPAYGQLLTRMKHFPDDESLAAIRARDVEYVIVHGAFYEPAAYRAVIAAMDQRPDLHYESQTRWEARETRVYRVVK